MRRSSKVEQARSEPAPPAMTRAAFAALYGFAEDTDAVRILRCGCGGATCRGWQCVVPGDRPLYPVPPD